MTQPARVAAGLGAVLAAVLVLAGCSGALAPSPSTVPQRTDAFISTPSPPSSALESTGAVASETPGPSTKASSRVPTPAPTYEPTRSAAALPGRPEEPAQAVGPPRAEMTVDGVKVQAWVPDTTIPTGGWLNALVRITNTNDEPVYLGGCSLLDGLDVDTEPLFDPGEHWDGAFGDFKRQVLERGAFYAHFELFEGRVGDCLPESAERMRAGERVDLQMVWHAVHLGREPLPPGDAVLYAGTVRDGRDGGRERPVLVEVPIHLEGDEPAYPSPGELVDVALRHPPFVDWLARHPRSAWLSGHWTAWPNEDGDYPPGPPYDRATDGAIDITLFAYGPTGLTTYGTVVVDPWTGEVIGTRFE